MTKHVDPSLVCHMPTLSLLKTECEPVLLPALRYHFLAGTFYLLYLFLIQAADFFQKSALIDGGDLGDNHNARFRYIRGSLF